MVEMHLAAIRVELPTNTPMVLLREAGGQRRTLPILIGHPEAMAIAYAIQGVETVRPMTHDLMRDLLSTLEVSVESIVVTDLVDGIYHAEIHLRRDGRQYAVSSRPSDAMALAVRVGAPIFADDALLEAEGVALPEERDQDELVDQFREFIDQVRPEDFAS